MPKDKKNSGVFNFFRSRVFRTLYPAVSKKQDIAKLNQDFYKVGDNKVNLIFDLNGAAWYIGENPVKESEDKPLLDAVLYTDNGLQLYDPKKIYIIMVDDTPYEQQDFNMKSLVSDGVVSVIGFNPMGLGKSTGKTTGPEDYQLALHSIIDNLYNNDIPSGNIILVGGSFPGAMATIVAEKYHAIDRKIGLVLKQENATFENVYAGFIPRVFGFVYRYLESLFKLNIDATKSFENLSKDTDATIKIVPEVQLPGLFDQLRQDRKNYLSELEEKSKVVMKLGKEILSGSLTLINELQEDYSIDDVSKKHGNILKINDALNEKSAECKAAIKQINILMTEANKKSIISKNNSTYIRNLLQLSQALLLQQENLDTAVHKYKAVSKTAIKIKDINYRLDNILKSRMYPTLSKQQAALEANRQQLKFENMAFIDQKQEVDDIINSASGLLNKMQLK